MHNRHDKENLFDWSQLPRLERAARRMRVVRYPDKPGSRGAAASRDAAEMFVGRAKVIRGRVLSLLKDALTGLSTHQVAERLRLPVTTVARQLTELRREGRIKPSGRRRRNESGATAHVWLLWPEGAAYVVAPEKP